MGAANTMKPHGLTNLQRLSIADPLINLTDRMDAPIAILRVVWSALRNPDLVDEYGLEYCIRTLEHATDMLEDAQKKGHIEIHALTESG